MFVVVVVVVVGGGGGGGGSNVVRSSNNTKSSNVVIVVVVVVIIQQLCNRYSRYSSKTWHNNYTRNSFPRHGPEVSTQGNSAIKVTGVRTPRVVQLIKLLPRAATWSICPSN